MPTGEILVPLMLTLIRIWKCSFNPPPWICIIQTGEFLPIREQLPPAKFIGFDNSKFGVMQDSMVSGGCIVSRSNLKKSLLFSNVKVEKHCDLEEVIALPGCVIDENSHIRKVVIDNGCKIPAGTIIGQDPKKDAERFHVTPGGVVFVNREMLGQRRRYLPASATQL